MKKEGATLSTSEATTMMCWRALPGACTFQRQSTHLARSIINRQRKPELSRSTMNHSAATQHIAVTVSALTVEQRPHSLIAISNQKGEQRQLGSQPETKQRGEPTALLSS